MHAIQPELPFESLGTTPPAWDDPGHVGFEIGWDHARHRLGPPVEHLQAGHPLRQGWEAGRAAFGARTLPTTPAVRQWLQLRTGAWLRGRAIETPQVSPAFLRRIDVAECPVTREPLAHGSGTPADASVERLNNDAGYAAGNLAVMSARASRAKAAWAWDDAMAFVRRSEAGRPGTIDGLDASQWARLAVLMSFTTPLPHAVAATLPLLVLPPPRVRLVNPVQALQALLTLQFTRDGYSRRIGELVALMPDADTRRALRMLMHTLLARRIAAGRLDGPAALRHALENLWCDARVLQRWQRLALRLDAGRCERILQAAERRDLAVPQRHWLPFESATEGRARATCGHVRSDRDAGAPRRRAAHVAAGAATSPVPQARRSGRALEAAS